MSVAKLDHLVFGVPDLERGIDLLAEKTGVRAAFGGRHQGRGTHNALLSLGGRQYLEIIALDPEQGGTPSTMFAELNHLREPKMLAWAAAVADVGEIARKAAAAGLQTRGPIAGSRKRADGVLLEWKSIVISEPHIAFVPFFIEWGNTPHPADDAPAGCTLTGTTIVHPQAEEVRRILTALGVEATVAQAPNARLAATLQTPRGQIELA